MSKIKSPVTSGRKGLPPNVASFKKPPKGISSPTLTGSRGKPHSHKFPGTPAARD